MDLVEGCVRFVNHIRGIRDFQRNLMSVGDYIGHIAFCWQGFRACCLCPTAERANWARTICVSKKGGQLVMERSNSQCSLKNRDSDTSNGSELHICCINGVKDKKLLGLGQECFW